jgi:hypothetical protein
MAEERLMDTWRTAVWGQFGAAIDTLAAAMAACPAELWRSRLWDHAGEPPGFSEFWYLVYHTLFFLDLYLSGAVEGFAPPAPYTLDELDANSLPPEQPYTKEQLGAYLGQCRAKCRATIEGLTAEGAGRICRFPWGELSYAELLLYNMRHVQEHASQLNLLLGQKLSSAPGWVTRARAR